MIDPVMPKKNLCVFTTAHPTDDVRVFRKMALTFAKDYNVIWIGPKHHFFEQENALNKMINWDTYEIPKGIKGRLSSVKKSINRLNAREDIDLVYVPDPDAAFLLTFFKKNKYKIIFDIHEVYHKDLLERRVNKLLYPVFSSILKYILSKVVAKVNCVTAVSHTVLRYYNKFNANSLVIRSCLPKEALASIDYSDQHKNDIFTVVHGKNHPSRGTPVVLEAMRILNENKVGCEVLMISQYHKDQQEYKDFAIGLKERKLESMVNLKEGMPFNQMQIEIVKSHVGLIAYGKDLGIDSLPNRLFEYMAAGIPVIVPEYAVEIVKIVKDEQCGLVIDMEDGNALANAITYLIANPGLASEMGLRGKAAFDLRHNWEVEVQPLLTEINKLVYDKSIPK